MFYVYFLRFSLWIPLFMFTCICIIKSTCCFIDLYPFYIIPWHLKSKYQQNPEFPSCPSRSIFQYFFFWRSYSVFFWCLFTQKQNAITIASCTPSLELVTCSQNLSMGKKKLGVISRTLDFPIKSTLCIVCCWRQYNEHSLLSQGW